VLAAGVYTLHFFLKGTCGVSIRDAAGNYWNGDEKILSWVSGAYSNQFSCAEWDDVFCFIVLNEDAPRLTIKVTGIEGAAGCIDYVRLFVKPMNHSYTIVIQYEGYG
jgi:hypothetical protein